MTHAAADAPPSAAAVDRRDLEQPGLAPAGTSSGSRAMRAAIESRPADDAHVTPAYIRRLCRMGLEAALPGVAALAVDDLAKPEDRLRAAEMLARVGVGYRTDATEGDERPLPGVILLPALQRPDGTLALPTAVPQLGDGG